MTGSPRGRCTQLRAMGLEEKIAANHHRYDGLRCIAHGITLEMPWPAAPRPPEPRLRGAPARPRHAGGGRGRGAGAPPCSRAPRRCRPSCATGSSPAPCVKDKATGEERELRARYVVIADGSLSRFGRALGNQRDKRLPAGDGHPGLLREPAARRPVDRVSASTCATATATPCPGYGWIFPCGDGTINVGIGLLSTFRGWREINTSHLMQEWAATAPAHWGIDPDAMLGDGHRRPPARWPARSTPSRARPGS